MAQIKTGANAPKSVSSVQAKAMARQSLAELLDAITFVALVRESVKGLLGENDEAETCKYAVEQALAGIGYLPESWAPVITARDRSKNKE